MVFLFFLFLWETSRVSSFQFLLKSWVSWFSLQEMKRGCDAKRFKLVHLHSCFSYNVLPTHTCLDPVFFPIDLLIYREMYDLMRKSREKGRLRSSKVECFSSHQLQEARDEYDEETNAFVFRMKSLRQGQSHSLLTQAARHHASQVLFWKLLFHEPMFLSGMIINLLCFILVTS